MKRYKIVGQKKSTNLTELNKEFIELIACCKPVQSRRVLEKQMSSLQSKLYRRNVFPQYDEKTINKAVERDLRDEATYVYAASLEDATDKVENYVYGHLTDAVNERKAALGNVEVLFNQLEDEAEALANEKFQQEYEVEYARLNSIIEGDITAVEQAFDKTFASYGDVQLPFTVDICIDYRQEQKVALVTAELPLDIGLPQQKENVSPTGRVSVKDKLLREMDDDTSKTIIGTAFYIASFVFNGSPNIENVEVAVWMHGCTLGYLWIKFDRNKFTSFRCKYADPLNAIFDWPYVCSMKMVRGGTRIDPLEAAVFNTSISKERNAYSQQWDSPTPSSEPKDDNTSEDTVSPNSTGNHVDLKQLDPLFDDAAEMVVGCGQGSTSMIQRKFSIGYNRAGLLMDQLEAAGIVGPYAGSKNRTVLVDSDTELKRILYSLKQR